jgi:hypothetical protein
MTQHPELSTALRELTTRTGLMRKLGSENGEPKLDWVDAVVRLIKDPAELERVEAEARELWNRGTRHIIWAGMGGSVMAVRVMYEMGFTGDGINGIAVQPLDSTDPAALNRIVESLAAEKGLAVTDITGDRSLLRRLLGDVMMVGVAMGMTSEEPITHLAWFVGLLEDAGLGPAEHLLVMALPESYLDRFAKERGAPSLALQLDGGTGTPGRFSAPSTRVFLLPAALYLTRRHGESGGLRSMLEEARNMSGLANPSLHHPSVRLAMGLADAAEAGACRLMLDLTVQWRPLLPWIEQLMEESLGKGGKGVLVFDARQPDPNASQVCPPGCVPFTIRGTDAPAAKQGGGAQGDEVALSLLARLSALFLDWELTTALYAYLNRITFAGQPAVENYKSRARELKGQDSPLATVEASARQIRSKGLTLLIPEACRDESPSPATVLANALREPDRLDYLDVTFNGEPPASWAPVWEAAQRLGNNILGIPVKVRRAPAAYHSTEQSEMDGPPALVSLRIITRRHEAPLLGRYDDRFLQAQAVATWQAMVEQGRVCFLLVADGSAEDSRDSVLELLEETARLILTLPSPCH